MRSVEKGEHHLLHEIYSVELFEFIFTTDLLTLFDFHYIHYIHGLHSTLYPNNLNK